MASVNWLTCIYYKTSCKHRSLPKESPTEMMLLASLRHPAHSSLRKEGPRELMLLTFVWDNIASGTARSKTENEPHSWSAPCFCMGWDCLWARWFDGGVGVIRTRCGISEATRLLSRGFRGKEALASHRRLAAAPQTLQPYHSMMDAATPTSTLPIGTKHKGRPLSILV